VTRREQFLLVGITLLGAALRLYQIGTQSLWFDELLSVTISRLNLLDALTVSGAIDPPLYYFLLHFWMGISHDDGTIRLLTALFSIATIPAIFFLGRRLLSVQAGLVAALIFAVAPLQVFYAQEARMYALLVFFSTLSIWAYHRAQSLCRWRDWTTWVALMTLAIYAHIFAGVLLVALDLDALWRWRAEKISLRAIILANSAIAFLLAPWMALLLPRFGDLVGILWLSPPTIFHPIITLDAFLFGYTLTFPFNILAILVVVVMLAFLLTSVWRCLRDSMASRKNEMRLLLLTAFFPMLFIWIISQFRSIYLDRWLLESSTPFYVLLAWGIVGSDRRAILRIGAMASAVLVFIALYNYFTVSDFSKPPYRQAIAYAAAQRTPNELIAHTSAGSFLAAQFYDQRGNHLLLYDPADQWLTPNLLEHLGAHYTTDASKALADQKEFWLIVALDHLEESQRARVNVIENFARRVGETQIGGIYLRRYIHAPSNP